MSSDTMPLLEGLTSPECPRWRDAKLWFSDIRNHRVWTVDLAGHAELVAEVTGLPTGLGWDTAGRLLIVGSTDRSVMRMDRGTLRPFADLSVNAEGDCNDMVIDGTGKGWIGDAGYAFFADAERKPGQLLHMRADGSCIVAAEGLDFPNGMAVKPDGRTLIVAETYGHRLTAFAIGHDGELTDRRVFAEWPGAYPDGICLDVEGAVWVADPGSNRVSRVFDGGRIAQTITVSEERRIFACMLGGEDGRTLFLCTNTPLSGRNPGSGKIEIAHVDVPGAGWP
jgi:sugar lactone lactonase YvrE